MSDAQALLSSLREAVGAGRSPTLAVRAELAGIGDPALMRAAGRVLADLRTDDARLRPVRVAVLSTGTVGSFEHLLRGSLVAAGALPRVVVGEYGAFEVSLGSASFARDGDPDIVVCVVDESYFLPRDWRATDMDGLGEHIDARLEDLRGLVAASLRRTGATMVLHTVPLPGPVRDTVISLRARARLAGIWHGLNAAILGLAAEHRQVMVVDLVSALVDGGFAARDDRLHLYADMPYTDGALLTLAHEVRRIVQASMGLSRKVLAVDLDNTLWGGVVGEVGAHGVALGGLYPGNCYWQLQRAIAELRDQGVVLVLTSKNDPDLVEEVLVKHPQMLLRSDAFAVSAVNWSPKVENLRHAAELLSLPLASFVFMDDSELERGHVTSELPEVAVVAAGGDPASLVRSLVRHGWFDVTELTDADRQRPAHYRTRSMRRDFADGLVTSAEYFRALNTVVVAEPLTPFTATRVAQLAVRTNQFNLTGRRFDETATTAMGMAADHLVASFSVSDRFGDEGIVGATWVERGARVWWVLNLVLSCRVLGRGVELAVLDWVAGQARQANATTLAGHYVPSGRNGVAGDFFQRAGFRSTGDDGDFVLDLGGASNLAPDWITLTGAEQG